MFPKKLLYLLLFVLASIILAAVYYFFSRGAPGDSCYIGSDCRNQICVLNRTQVEKDSLGQPITSSEEPLPEDVFGKCYDESFSNPCYGGVIQIKSDRTYWNPVCEPF